MSDAAGRPVGINTPYRPSILRAVFSMLHPPSSQEESFRQRLRAWYRQDVESYLYHSPLETLLATAPPPFPNLQVRLCDRANLPSIQQEIHDVPSIVGQHVARGDLAILAVKDGEWIFRSTAVLGVKTYPVTGYPLALQQHEAYLECAETIPSWRGKGVAPGMLRPTAQALLARGVTVIYLLIDIANTSSLRAAEKGGARRIGLITSHRRFGTWTAEFAQIPEPEVVPKQ